jgi:hypothetical protein
MRLSGTPASSMARQPPHTDAMEEEPLDSVMFDSTRMEYGNSSCHSAISQRIVTVGFSGGGELTRPFRDARRFPSTRL